jgi:hypothetical protein
VLVSIGEPRAAGRMASGAAQLEFDRHGGVDFDLHGLVGVRLMGATAGDVAAVRRQLGPVEGTLARRPDIVIRFLPQLALRGPVRLLGLGETGFTENDFFILRDRNNAPIKLRIPFEQLGEQCELVCQSGISAIPLLIAIVNLTALARGALPLHATAFRYRGCGALVTGWAKGGKTEALLAFMAHGAEYIGDEWVYLDQNGRMHGIPEPIRVWDSHLTDLPQLRRRLPRGSRSKLWTLKRLIGLVNAGRNGLPRYVSGRVLSLLNRQLHVQVPPEKLAGYFAARGGETKSVSLGTLTGSCDKLVFIGSHDSPKVVARPIDPREVARRMVFSLQQEQQVLQSHYWMFRFAFPQRSNPLIEQLESLQRARLSEFLAGKEAYEVLHPYPAPIPKLFDVMRPLFES